MFLLVALTLRCCCVNKNEKIHSIINNNNNNNKSEVSMMSTRGKKNKSTKSRGLGSELTVRCVGFCGIDDSVSIDDVIQFAKEHGDIAELAVLFRREMEVSNALCYVMFTGYC